MKSINNKIQLIIVIAIVSSLVFMYFNEKNYNENLMNNAAIAYNNIDDEELVLPSSGGSSSGGSSGGNKPVTCKAGQYKSGNSCYTCPAGYRCASGEKHECSAGTYSSSGSSRCSKCTGNTYSSAGASSCRDCGSDYRKDDHTGCNKCSVSVSAITEKISPEESGAFFSVNASNCNGTLSTNGNLSGISVTDHYINIFEIKVSKPCTTITGKASIGGHSGSASAKVMDTWKLSCSHCCTKASYTEQMPSNILGNDIYGSGKISLPFGVGYCYDQVWNRSCGGISTIKTYDYCCVDNGFVGVSENVFWDEYRLKKDCSYYHGSGYTLLEIPKDQCVKKEAASTTCKDSPLPAKAKDKFINNCEDALSMTIDEGTKCSSTSQKDSFYEIKCDRVVKTNFDYDADDKTDTKRELYNGNGFKFGIDVTTSLKCTGKFNDTRWKEVYRLFKEKVKAVEYGYTRHGPGNQGLVYYIDHYDAEGYSKYIDTYLKSQHKQGAKDAFYLWNTYYEPLISAVKTYNAYPPEKEYKEAAELTMDTKVNGKSAPMQVVFDKEIKDVGKYQVLSHTKLNLGITSNKWVNPENYVKSSEAIPRQVRLVPPKKYIGSSTGEISVEKSSEVKSIDGGNRIYFDYDTDPGVYNMTIKVTGLAGNDSTVTNNKCDVTVKRMEYLYRPIELKNPFINNDWQKGENWINRNYNFTNTIHKNTWSEATLKTIDLSSSQIIEIQNSTKKYTSNGYLPYLGICDTVKTSGQDSVTKTLCNNLKSLSS